ncbi:MAG: hypothetical protein HY275_03555 [Gemmatimonadetes bacterium]|nr:hypothetical protein [Gemmatimonadota bacterium]
MTAPQTTPTPFLPLSVPDDRLALVPDDLRWQYAPALEGGNRRRYISADDPHYARFVDEIASGVLEVLPAGQTPETIAAAHAAREALSASVLEEANRLTAADEQRRAANARAWQERHDAGQAELRRRGVI